MDHNQQHDDLIDLGIASLAIQGGPDGDLDEHSGQNPLGLSND